MKILLINNHHKIVGGAERYYFDLAKLLRSKGHTVAYFSMRDIGNAKTSWEKYFVSNVDPNNSGFKEIFVKIPRIFYSFEAKHKIGKLLDIFKPDIVHIQSIYYHISPSIIGEIKKRGIPIVQTVHDYQLISPNVIMYHDDKNCEIFEKRKYYKSILHKCVGGSYIGSFLSVAGLYIQNFNNYYQKNINMFITPSNFMKKKLIEYGINRNKVVHLDNFIKTNEMRSSTKTKEKYILYFGRLAESKGIFELINVAKELPKIKVIFAGKFGETSDQNRANQIIKFKRIKNVKFVGFKNKVQLEKLISGCSFVVVPSKWNENQPYSVLESFALGKAVLASNVGGVPEIIQNDKNGLLFESGNMKDFKQKINKLWNDPAYVDKLGKNAKKLAFEKYNSEVHYKKLFTIYNDLIG